MYKVVVFVPESHLENVKAAMFSAGAGCIGNYDCCSWQVKGEGQFRALEGSQAYIGELNKLEKVEEFRLELVCSESNIKPAIQALLNAHPYETPAFEVLKMIDLFYDEKP